MSRRLANALTVRTDFLFSFKTTINVCIVRTFEYYVGATVAKFGEL